MKRWQDVKTIDDVRSFVGTHPDSGISVAWGQMLEDMDEFGDEYSMDDFHEEAETQAYDGNQ
jgi:hypothetical protein